MKKKADEALKSQNYGVASEKYASRRRNDLRQRIPDLYLFLFHISTEWRNDHAASCVCPI